MHSKLFVCLAMLFCVAGQLLGEEFPAVKLPPGYVVAPGTISPDGRYGVSAFNNTAHKAIENDKALQDEFDHLDNHKIIDLHNWHTLGVLVAAPRPIEGGHGLLGYDEHGSLPAQWSSDSSVLLWKVDGKWCPDTLVLVKLGNEAVQWQLDLLQTAQQELLRRTRRAAPALFAAASKANGEQDKNASYPQGFVVDVEALGSVALPLRVRVVLTSDPKAFEASPKLKAKLRSYLEGRVDASGRFVVEQFRLGFARSPHFDP